MGLEVATYVSQLVDTNPASSDLRSQGDDHLRLIKDVLQNTFPNADKAHYFPTTAVKAASFTVLAAEQARTFYVSTAAGAVVMTLPVLVAADAGWECSFIKTNSGVLPIYVTPAAGTLNSGGVTGLARARRAIPGVRVSVVWDGTGWFVTRALAVPIGTMIDFHGSSAPAGFEWPNGQTLAAAATDYPEYLAVTGAAGTWDLRGRVGVTLDNLGGVAAGRLPGGIIVGTAIGATGGTDTVTLSLAQAPTGITSVNAAQPISVASTLSDWVRGLVSSRPNTGGPAIVPEMHPLAQVVSSGNNSISVTSNNTGGLAHSNLQPSIMLGKLLVVE